MHSNGTDGFDELAADLRWHAFTRQERQIVEDFARRWDIKRGQHVLEPGCGTGRLTEVLAGLAGPTGSVVAFDASAKLIRIASERRLPAQVHLHTARAETFVVPSGAFDHVVCFNVFPHLVPHVRIARRLARALRPGGVLWIAHTRSRGCVNAVHRRAASFMHDHLLPEPEVLGRWLREAGLHGFEVGDDTDRFLAWAVRPARRSRPRPSPKTCR